MSDGYDELADRLAEIAADLDDRSFTMLREASAKRTGRPVEDKLLTQARRSIEKAIHLLRRAGATTGDDAGAAPDLDD